MRGDVLPEDEDYAFVEVSKGEPAETAATKLFEFSDWDDVQIPPDGPLEFYVVFDADGNEVPEGGFEGDNPGGSAGDDGLQDSEQKAVEDDIQILKITATDGELDGKVVGLGVDFPNSGVYVDWLNEQWPEDQQLDGPHVSDYDTVADLKQATDNKVEMVDHLEGLSQKLDIPEYMQQGGTNY